MANKKIPCGGFEIGDGLELDGITLKSNGGDNLISYPKENGNYILLLTKDN